MKRFTLFWLLAGVSWAQNPSVRSNGQAPVYIDSSYSYEQIQAFLKQGFAQNNATLQAKAYYLLAVREQAAAINNEQTVAYLQKSHQLFSQTRDVFHLNRTKLALASSYAELKTYDQALELQHEALRYFEQTRNRFMVAHAMASLANTYRLMCDFSKEKMYLKFSEINNKYLRDNTLQLIVFNNQVINFQHQRQYDSALVVAGRLLKLAKATNKTNFVIGGLFYEGIQNQFKGNYRTAIARLHDCLAAIPNVHLSLEAKQCYLHLSQCYESLRDYPNAYRYSQRYAQATNAILDNQRQTALQRQALQFDFEGKRRQILNLEKEKAVAEQTALWQRTVAMSVGVAAVVLLCALFSVLYFYRQKIRSERVIEHQKEEIKQKEINELKQELSLQNIQAIVTGQETERERIAKDLHDSLGGMLATVRLRFDALRPKRSTQAYDESLSMLDATIQEVRHIARNLQPDALLQFGLTAALRDLVNRTHGPHLPDVEFQHYGSDFELLPTQSLTVFRIVQELLQNALKHARATEILIQLNWQYPTLMILVEDDGVGYNPAVSPQGMGTRNIKTRVDYLKAHLEVQSALGKGTTVVVTVGVDVY
jgi:signal transduction histidine kinase